MTTEREPFLAAAVGRDRHFALSQTGGLIRILDEERAERSTSQCCWRDCTREPVYEVATPGGHLDFCHGCIDYALASLPPEWLSSWEWREPEPDDGEENDDIPF